MIKKLTRQQGCRRRLGSRASVEGRRYRLNGSRGNSVQDTAGLITYLRCTHTTSDGKWSRGVVVLNEETETVGQKSQRRGYEQKRDEELARSRSRYKSNQSHVQKLSAMESNLESAHDGYRQCQELRAPTLLRRLEQWQKTKSSAATLSHTSVDTHIRRSSASRIDLRHTRRNETHSGACAPLALIPQPAQGART
jgi:hypothetical protein